MESKADALASFRPHDLAPVESALKEIEEKFRAPRTQGGVTAIRHFPAREPRVEPFPASLPPRVVEILKARGFASLYTHQAAAFTWPAKARTWWSSRPRHPARRSATTCRS